MLISSLNRGFSTALSDRDNYRYLHHFSMIESGFEPVTVVDRVRETIQLNIDWRERHRSSLFLYLKAKRTQELSPFWRKERERDERWNTRTRTVQTSRHEDERQRERSKGKSKANKEKEGKNEPCMHMLLERRSRERTRWIDWSSSSLCVPRSRKKKKANRKDSVKEKNRFRMSLSFQVFSLSFSRISSRWSAPKEKTSPGWFNERKEKKEKQIDERFSSSVFLCSSLLNEVETSR